MVYDQNYHNCSTLEYKGLPIAYFFVFPSANVGFLKLYENILWETIAIVDTMCPDDTATAGSWAGVGLVN
jgi:hypothetical protein